MFCGQEDKNRQRGNSEDWLHPIPPAPALLSSQNHFAGQTGLEPSIRHTLLPLHLNSELEHSSFLGQGSQQSMETMSVGRYGTTVEKPTVASLL